MVEVLIGINGAGLLSNVRVKHNYDFGHVNSVQKTGTGVCFEIMNGENRTVVLSGG